MTKETGQEQSLGSSWPVSFTYSGYPCRQARALRPLTVAAFAVCNTQRAMPTSSRAPPSRCRGIRRMESANEPCRQARGLRPLAVAAFAVCNRKNLHPAVSELPPSACFPVCAWLIAARKKRDLAVPPSCVFIHPRKVSGNYVTHNITWFFLKINSKFLLFV